MGLYVYVSTHVNVYANVYVCIQKQTINEISCVCIWKQPIYGIVCVFVRDVEMFVDEIVGSESGTSYGMNLSWNTLVRLLCQVNNGIIPKYKPTHVKMKLEMSLTWVVV